MPKEHVVTDAKLMTEIIDDNNRVYYEVFVHAFSDSDKDGIGDLRGLIDRLDYLNDGDPNSGKSLGVQGLWLMPIMPSPSYHKYDVKDYKDIDPAYGTLADFADLIAACDERGIDVIIDLVLNHTSNAHPWFTAARRAMRDGDTESKYLDYYTLVTSSEKESGKTYHTFYGDYFYEGNFSGTMPELNLDNADVREEIIDIVTFWYGLGVKGFRLDAIKYAYLGEESRNVEFWNWFAAECRKILPDTYIVGEVWSGDSLIAPYYECFSNFDFGMSQSMGAIAVTANGMDSVNWYVAYLNSYRNLIASINPDAILTPFISNHDMNRAAGYLSVADYRMHMATNLYLWTFGTPFLYYGEEIGMKGIRGTEQTDANRRLAMLWGDRDKVADPPGATYNPKNQTNGTVKSQIGDADSLYNHYKKVIMLRNANPEIARGAYTPLNFPDHEYFGGFLSTWQDATVGVFHNTGLSEVTIDLSQYSSYQFTQIRGWAGKGSSQLEGQILTLSGLTSVILG